MAGVDPASFTPQLLEDLQVRAKAQQEVAAQRAAVQAPELAESSPAAVGDAKSLNLPARALLPPPDRAADQRQPPYGGNTLMLSESPTPVATTRSQSPLAPTFTLSKDDTLPGTEAANNLPPSPPSDVLPPAPPTASSSRLTAETSRVRARALIAALRTTRARAGELQTGLEALERQLQLLRSATESQKAQQAAQAATLQQQLDAVLSERDRLTAEVTAFRNASAAAQRESSEWNELSAAHDAANERVLKLSEELASRDAAAIELRTRFEAAGKEAAALRSQLAERHQQITALQQQLGAATRTAPASDESLEKLRTELRTSESKVTQLVEQQRNSEQQHEALRKGLATIEARCEQLQEELATAESARQSCEQQYSEIRQQQARWLSECQTLQREHASAMETVVSERDALQRELSELTRQRTAPTPVAADVDKPAAAEAAASPAPMESWPAWTAESGALASSVDTSPADEPAPASTLWPASDASDSGDSASKFVGSHPTAAEAQSDARQALATPSPGGASARAATPDDESVYQATSFIERYRHLLEDGAEPDVSPRLSRPVLDDEYLSPAKAQVGDNPDEDSDEALEAYMSNLMRRVRGDQTESAGPAPIPIVEPIAVAATDADGRPDAAAAPAENTPSAEEPGNVDANGLSRLPRKLPEVANLNVLREIANVSARTAIAQHRQQRRFESAISKSIICLATTGVTAYLLYTAPKIDSPWFWGGCVTLVAAAGSAAQLCVLAWQRKFDPRRARESAAPTGVHAEFGAPAASGRP